MRSTDSDFREQIVSFLENAARGKAAVVPALLTAIHIVRESNSAASVPMARRMVLRWPSAHNFRFVLAYCLDMAGGIDAHLEALKQRLIGVSLKLQGRKKTGELAKAQYAELLESHFGRAEEILAFLKGERRYPTDKVQMLAMRRRSFPQVEVKHLMRLVSIVNIAGLPVEADEPAKVTCAVDTNAISNKSVSEWFGTPGLAFVAPAEILLGLSEWNRINAFPLGLDFVRIKLVPDRIPPEISNMFSRDKREPPSLMGKKVAVLALREKADAIVSGERRLWDSDLPFLMEKYFAHVLAVVQPSDFSTWLTNKGYGAPSPRVVPVEEAHDSKQGHGGPVTAVEDQSPGGTRGPTGLDDQKGTV